jgi:hypothetical protein
MRARGGRTASSRRPASVYRLAACSWQKTPEWSHAPGRRHQAMSDGITLSDREVRGERARSRLYCDDPRGEVCWRRTEPVVMDAECTHGGGLRWAGLPLVWGGHLGSEPVTFLEFWQRLGSRGGTGFGGLGTMRESLPHRLAGASRWRLALLTSRCRKPVAVLTEVRADSARGRSPAGWVRRPACRCRS